MREALAARPDDDDFIISAPVRRRSAARPPRKKPGTGERLMQFIVARPRHVVAALFLSGCGGFIAWNALMHQTAPHPAPLFVHGQAPAAPRALPPTRPAPQQSLTETPAPVPPTAADPAPAAPVPPKPASRSAIADLIKNGGETGSTTANPRPAPRPAAAASAGAPMPLTPPAAKVSTAKDPIAEMIRLGGPVPVPPSTVGKPDAGDVVLAGQRALAKLGYGIKPDGVMGPGTRQAIERFEQDRRLPVTGEFSARTVRELSALSGIPVQ